MGHSYSGVECTTVYFRRLLSNRINPYGPHSFYFAFGRYRM
jgi:hypothetical protein